MPSYGLWTEKDPGLAFCVGTNVSKYQFIEVITRTLIEELSILIFVLVIFIFAEYHVHAHEFFYEIIPFWGNSKSCSIELGERTLCITSSWELGALTLSLVTFRPSTSSCLYLSTSIKADLEPGVNEVGFTINGC